jgi:hypothetical protein
MVVLSVSMDKDILRYQGYRTTPPLWEDDSVMIFPQIKLPDHQSGIVDSSAWKQQRLGKLVEEFVFHDLKHSGSVSWVTESLQIQNDKLTLGELDALYFDQGTPVHLEIAYKFYLYDTQETYRDPLGPWIGPNRRDNLSKKLDKIRERQFPLLQNPYTKPYLEQFGLDPLRIQQRLCFKGQLFLPYRDQNLEVHPLNPACVFGFYLPYQELSELKDLAFYLPEKLDWLITPHPMVEWISYPRAAALIRTEIEEERSPMVWLKSTDGSLGKCFVVFWCA